MFESIGFQQAEELPRRQTKKVKTPDPESEYSHVVFENLTWSSPHLHKSGGEYNLGPKNSRVRLISGELEFGIIVIVDPSSGIVYVDLHLVINGEFAEKHKLE